jgi:hypothetical protein
MGDGSSTTISVLEDVATHDAEGWPLIPPTQVTVHRTSREDVRERQVIVSIDGERVADLLYGQTFTGEIAPGHHTIRANNTLVWKTLEFDAAAGAHLHFTCINRAPRGLYYLVGILGIAPLLVSLRPGGPDDPT